MAGFFDFSDDEDYVAPESEQLSSKKLPPLSLGMGAKASMRVEDVYKNARRFSDSSRFSIPLTGAAKYPSVPAPYAASDESEVDTEREHSENELISDVEHVDKSLFDYRLGSTHTFTQTEIKLTAPARGASFSSDHIDDLVLVDRPALDGLNSLSKTMVRENDPFKVPTHTPEEFETKLDDSEMIDMQSFVHKLDGVRPPRHRRLHSFDTYDELHNAKGKRSPHATPQNGHEPQTFEKLVQKVYKMTPRGADEVPFYDGVYEQEMADNYPPIPEDTKILPTVTGQVLDTIPMVSEPVMVPIEEVNKFKRWMEMHGIDPAIVDEPPRPPTFPLNSRFLCPSPNGAIPPLLSKSSGGMSMFSTSSGTDISRLGITPSPVTPNQPTIRDFKLRQELEAALVESNAKECALKQAVEQLGRSELEMEKFKQKAKKLEEENSALRAQVNDLVQSRQKILVSASRQFDVFRRKINPPQTQVMRR